MLNNPITSIAQQAAQLAGELTLQDLEKNLEISDKKSHMDIVTPTDIASEKKIKETIISLWEQEYGSTEGLGFVGEETFRDQTEHQFVIDPIDGTTNFAQGIPFYAISIAYLHNGVVTVGVIFDPVHQVFYLAEKNNGAWRQQQGGQPSKMIVSPRELRDSVLSTHLNSQEVAEKQFQLYAQLYREVRGMRNLGSIVLELAMVCQNYFQGLVNGGCYIWDLAAASLLIQEAGGVTVSWQGEPLVLDVSDPEKMYQVVAGDKQTVDQILGTMQL